MAGTICFCTYAVAAGANICHASAASSSAAIAGDRAEAAAHDAVTLPHIHWGLHNSKTHSLTVINVSYQCKTAWQLCNQV